MMTPSEWADCYGAPGHVYRTSHAGYANLAWSIAHIIGHPVSTDPDHTQALVNLMTGFITPWRLQRAAKHSRHILFPGNITNTTWDDQHDQIAQHQWITTTPTGPHDLRECVETEAHAYIDAAHVYAVYLFRIPATDRRSFTGLPTINPFQRTPTPLTGQALSEITGWPLTETEQICGH